LQTLSLAVGLSGNKPKWDRRAWFSLFGNFPFCRSVCRNFRWPLVSWCRRFSQTGSKHAAQVANVFEPPTGFKPMAGERGHRSDRCCVHRWLCACCCVCIVWPSLVYPLCLCVCASARTHVCVFVRSFVCLFLWPLGVLATPTNPSPLYTTLFPPSPTPTRLPSALPPPACMALPLHSTRRCGQDARRGAVARVDSRLRLVRPRRRPLHQGWFVL
jgi:hypothetical protein